MKNDRQTAVLQIIEETAVETQEQLLERLQLIFTRALAKKSGSNQAFSKVVTDLAAKCSRQKLYRAAEALTHGVSLLQANGSAGHCVGYLLATMRS